MYNYNYAILNYTKLQVNKELTFFGSHSGTMNYKHRSKVLIRNFVDI